MKKIMVAVDGSTESEAAAIKAAELSKALGAKLTIVCVGGSGDGSGRGKLCGHVGAR